eukprot:GHRR01035086.1.p1 GENE.GHRR01035086.1~~GHRR01035086.1.p1  ORF type:complete len:112 (+),score=18.42 GHRR01035086.1:30-338(+)
MPIAVSVSAAKAAVLAPVSQLLTAYRLQLSDVGHSTLPARLPIPYSHQSLQEPSTIANNLASAILKSCHLIHIYQRHQTCKTLTMTHALRGRYMREWKEGTD